MESLISLVMCVYLETCNHGCPDYYVCSQTSRISNLYQR